MRLRVGYLQVGLLAAATVALPQILGLAVGVVVLHAWRGREKGRRRERKRELMQVEGDFDWLLVWVVTISKEIAVL